MDELPRELPNGQISFVVLVQSALHKDLECRRYSFSLQDVCWLIVFATLSVVLLAAISIL